MLVIPLYKEYLLTKPSQYLTYSKYKYSTRTKQLIYTRLRKSLIDAYKRSMKVNREFTITMDWALKSYTGYCYLTGIKFRTDRDITLNKIYSPSIDRINNTEGYTENNCRWILLGLNSFKGSAKDEDLFKIAEAMLKHRDTNVY